MIVGSVFTEKLQLQWVIVMGLAFVGAGCEPSAVSLGDLQPAGTVSGSVTTVKSRSHMPKCSKKQAGIMFYIQDSAEFMFCDGKDFQPLDLGPLSSNCVVTVEADSTTVECDNGTTVVVHDASQTTPPGGPASAVCSVSDNGDGTKTISCADGSSVTVSDGSSCSVADNGDGTKTIACEDGTSVVVSDGAPGAAGSSCTVVDNGDGTKTISCDDGSEVVVSDGTPGENGTSCTVVDNGDGTKTISCEDGTSVVVSDGAPGEPGTSCTVSQNGNGTFTMVCPDGSSVTWGDAFCDLGDCWVDGDTGLIWQIPDPAAALENFSGAEAYCDQLTGAGSDAWRLPTIGELRTLVRDCSEHETGSACGIADDCTEASCLNECYDYCAGSVPGDDVCYWEGALGSCPETEHWSSSRLIDGGNDTNYVWTLRFTDGTFDVEADQTGLSSVICVRESDK